MAKKFFIVMGKQQDAEFWLTIESTPLVTSNLFSGNEGLLTRNTHFKRWV